MQHLYHFTAVCKLSDHFVFSASFNTPEKASGNMISTMIILHIFATLSSTSSKGLEKLDNRRLKPKCNI